MKSETTKILENLNLMPKIVKENDISTKYDILELGFIRIFRSEYDLYSKKINNFDELIKLMNRRVIEGILTFNFEDKHKWYNSREKVFFKVRNVIHLLSSSLIFDKKNNLKFLLDYLYTFTYLSDKMEEFALKTNPEIFNGDSF